LCDRHYRSWCIPHRGALRKPELSTVDRGGTVDRFFKPYLSDAGAGSARPGLSGDEHNAFLRAGHRDGAWPDRSHAAAEDAGQLSVLARVLHPYAGEQSREVALRLIRAFGSLRGIYTASSDSLAEVISGEPCSQNLLAAAIAVARDIAMLAA